MQGLASALVRVMAEANALFKLTDMSASSKSEMKKTGRRFIFSSTSRALVHF